MSRPHPFIMRDELEKRAEALLNGRVDPVTTIGVVRVGSYSITTRNGDLHIIKELPDARYGSRPDPIYHRDSEWLMKTFQPDKVLEFLEALRRLMILDDLANA